MLKITSLTTICLLLLATLVLTTGEAQPNTVTKVMVTAKPNTFAGRCPTNVEFVGTIFVSRPTRVDYRWERSDGVIGPRESVDIRSAGKGVTTSWQVGTPRRPFNGWQKLRVLSPNMLLSNPAAIQIKCN